MSKSTFEDIIKRDGKLVYTHVGNSMWPLIRRVDDLLVIEPVEGRLQRFDVPLYRRDNGQVVLHRVLKVRPQDYVICGDNGWSRETGITDKHVIGRLMSISRDGKELPLSGWKYQIYVFFWCRLFPLRAFGLKVFRVLKRIIK